MASTKWWYCDDCGFANHPRSSAQYQDAEINLKCEQCGAASAQGLDYKPEGA